MLTAQEAENINQQNIGFSRSDRIQKIENEIVRNIKLGIGAKTYVFLSHGDTVEIEKLRNYFEPLGYKLKNGYVSVGTYPDYSSAECIYIGSPKEIDVPPPTKAEIIGQIIHLIVLAGGIVALIWYYLS